MMLFNWFCFFLTPEPIFRPPPCLFLQSLMGNFDVSASFSVSNTAATVSRELRYMYMLLKRICLNIVRLYPKLFHKLHIFEISIIETWRRPENLNWEKHTLRRYRLKKKTVKTENYQVHFGALRTVSQPRSPLTLNVQPFHLVNL